MSRSTPPGFTEEMVTEFLASLKLERRNTLAAAYDALGKLDAAQRSDLVEYVIRTPSPDTYGFDPTERSFARALGEHGARGASSALRLIILAVLGSTAAAVVEKFAKAGLISPESLPIVREILAKIDTDRERVAAVLRGRDIATESLPSLEAFEIALDVRLGFSDKAMTTAIPIAVVHIDTDGENRELWFQMSRPQVEAMVKARTLHDRRAGVHQVCRQVECRPSRLPPLNSGRCCLQRSVYQSSGASGGEPRSGHTFYLRF